MTTQTVTTIPAPRTPEVEEVETVPCCFDAEPVTDMAEHTIPGGCVECFDYYVKEN
jgi:hypothetical protein